MDKQFDNTANNLGNLYDDVQAMLESTAHVSEAKVVNARKRLTETLEKGKAALAQVQDKARESAKAADQMVRKNPYQAIGIALGVGAILGVLISRRD